MRDDTVKAELLSTISLRCLQQGNAGEALHFAKLSLATSQHIGWETGQMDAYNDLGNLFESAAEYPEALDAYFKALRIAERANSQIGLAVLYGNISNVYLHQKAYAPALDYNFRFLKLADELKDPTALLIALGNIGNVYSEQGDYSTGIKYQQRALAIAEEESDTGNIATNLANIGNSYFKLGDYTRSLSYSFQALRLSKNFNKAAVELKAGILGNIGGVYLALATDSIQNAADGLVPSDKRTALLKAVDYLQQGAAVSQSAALYPNLMEISGDLTEAYAQLGDYKAALAAHINFTGAKDTIFNTENSRQIANLETRRALQLKEKDIEIGQLAVAKKRNERTFFIAGIALLLAALALLFSLLRRQQQSNVLLQREKQRSDDLLLNILPAEVADELKEKGITPARQYEEVTILFTDFANFTGVAAQLTPQVLVAELNMCFTAFDAIIERNGLEKIKTIGDAYMAVCGLPTSDVSHASKTVRAGLEIRDFIASSRDTLGRTSALDIRIGINSGPVVAGIIGVKKFAYDVWGDAVNTAARMEQNSTPGKVNISQSTYDLVKQGFVCTPRGRLSAKNKGEVEMYFVESAADIV